MKVKSVHSSGLAWGRLTTKGKVLFEKDVGHICSKPAKHIRSVINHMVNYIGILSNEWAGAQAFSSVDTYLSAYILKDEFEFYKQFKQDGLDDTTARKLARKRILREVEQSIQEFMFHVNYPTRYGSQSPFINVTLDLKVPDDLKDQLVLIDNEVLTDFDGKQVKYGDLQEYIDIFNKTFFKVYLQGDGKGSVFTFPIITINLTEYFFNDLDPEVRDLILEANVKFGATYFQNCINGYIAGRKIEEGDSRAMCCLHPDSTILVLFDNEDEAIYLPIKLLIQEDLIENPNFKILTPQGFLRPKKAFRIKFSGELIEIKVYDPQNKISTMLLVTPDHIQPVFYVDGINVKRLDIEAQHLDMSKQYHLLYKHTLLPIKAIRRIKYDGYVYDFEMPEHLPYFYANDILTHNCRLQIDVKEMLAYSKGLFSAGDYVGSVGVVTLNMAVLGYLAKGSKEKFFKLLDKWMDISVASLVRKKKAVIELLKKGLYPFTWTYLPYKQFESHFLTIGYCGLHEACVNMGFDGGIVSEEGLNFAKEVLQHMLDRLEIYKQEYDMLFNLEATPAEGASYRLARLSKKRFPNMYVSEHEGTPFLTNSCHLPVDMQNDFAFVTKHQDQLQPLHSGGTVVHYYVGSELDKETLLNILKIVGYETKIPYFTVTPVISICPVHGRVPGNYEYCPYDHTEEELEKYGVVVGSDRKVRLSKHECTSC